MNWSYSCIECGTSYTIEPGRYLCDTCAAAQTPDKPLRGQLEVKLTGGLPEEWDRLRRVLSNAAAADGPGRKEAEADREELDSAGQPDEILRRADPLLLLPVERMYFPPIPVGNTPLWRPARLRNELGLSRLFLKDDTANPTGSLKDRASYLVAAFALKYGLPDIVVASTGNAGSSMSGVGAAAGLSVRLYLPASAPQAKMVQALQYGADLVKVKGNYDQAFDESLAYVTAHGGLSRNTAHNPLTVEGKKTVAIEMFLQLWGMVPDMVYVPTGDGVILSGVYKGFEDLVSLGLASGVPEVVCVQADGSAAITRALAQGDFGKPEASSTIADSISVDVPRGGYYALKRLQRHGGRCVTVSDQAIISAQRRLSSGSGLFAEPAASAAFAGLLADMESGRGPGKTGRAVVLLTGSGLKDISGAMKGVET
jgi:threonine synthase